MIIDGEQYEKADLLDSDNNDLFLEVVDYGTTVAEQNDDVVKDYKGELYLLEWTTKKYRFYKLRGVKQK